MDFKRPFWVRFDVDDRLHPAPAFCLVSPSAGEVCLADFRGDCSLAVYFAPHTGWNPCPDTLQRLSERESEYRQVGARLLAILPDAGNIEQTGAQSLLLLDDRDGTARQRYVDLMAPGMVREDDSMLFVLDEFGAPYAALIGADQATENLHTDTLSWLEFISVQCPE